VTVPATEQRLPLAPPGSFGEFTEVRVPPALRHALVCYLTAPLPTESRIDFVVISAEDADEYLWSFSHGAKGWNVEHVTDGGLAHVTVQAPGQLKTKVVIRKEGATKATLTLTQNVTGPDATFRPLPETATAAARHEVFALHEICEELKPYVDEAAASTGANGIPARLLAAVLFMEARARPKDGSPFAGDIRRRLSGEYYTPRLSALADKLKKKGFAPGSARMLDLHDIRDEEIDLIREMINLTEWDPSYAFASGKTLGVGQIAQTTAAMALGLIPWQELHEKTRKTDLDTIESGFMALDKPTKIDIYNSLRFPKRNVFVAAKLLAKLKNRPHRFPTLSAKAVLTNDQAIEAIATEYNRGGFDTPTADLESNFNGRFAKRLVRAPSEKGLDQFYPDPP
jgi:hypothetical protein